MSEGTVYPLDDDGTCYLCINGVVAHETYYEDDGSKIVCPIFCVCLNEDSKGVHYSELFPNAEDE